MFTDFGLCGGRVDRCVEAIGFAEPVRQFDAADRTGLLVVGQPRTGQVAAGHALDGEHGERFADESPSGNLSGHIGGHHVVADDVLQLVEPPRGQSGEDCAFVGDLGFQHEVVRGDSVGGDHQQRRGVGKRFSAFGYVEVANFAGVDVLPSGNDGGLNLVACHRLPPCGIVMRFSSASWAMSVRWCSPRHRMRPTAS